MTGFRSRWFPLEPENWITSFETDLLLQDFQLHVVPYRRRPAAYRLSVSGASPDQLNQSLSLDRDKPRPDGFLRSVATRLLTHHEVWIEVAFGGENRDGTPFRLLAVEGVKRTQNGNLVQELPSRDKLPDWYGDGDGWGQEVELDIDRMVHITLPASYPSGLLKQVVRGLSLVRPAVLPPRFRTRSVDQLVDANEAMRTERLSVSQAALPIGWTARESSYGQYRQMNDYYFHLRELRFLLFRSSMRARAEDALRDVLTLAGKRCRFAATVTAYGVHTPAEVEGFIRDFEEGKLTFSAVREVIFETGKDEYSRTRSVI